MCFRRSLVESVAYALVCRDLHLSHPASLSFKLANWMPKSLKPGAGGRVCPRRRCSVLFKSVVEQPRRGSTRALSFGPAAASRDSGGPSGFRRPTLSQAWSGIGNPRTAMCVRNVDVHVSCSSHVDAQFAAFFIDPRAE